jgi:3-oxoacyl-[acyl-carrier-protein] synthase II
MRAEILGIGWVSVAGLGRGRGDSSFTLAAGALPAIARQDVFAEPDLRFGRLDPFSKVGLTAIALAMQDAGLDRWTQKRPVALIVGSDYGCLGTDADYFDGAIPQGGQLASPNLFAYTLPNCFLGEAAIRFGLTGPAWVASAAEPDDLSPLRQALETIAWGEAEMVVAGCCDIPRPDFLAPAADAPGAVFFLLAKAGTAPEASAYGELVLAASGEFSVGGAEVATLEELVRRLRSGRDIATETRRHRGKT